MIYSHSINIYNYLYIFFFFNDPATTEIYTRKDTLSLHDALPISLWDDDLVLCLPFVGLPPQPCRSEEHTSELQSPFLISYAVFCLKKKKVGKRMYEFPVAPVDDSDHEMLPDDAYVDHYFVHRAH